jgi:hypothetical protein
MCGSNEAGQLATKPSPAEDGQCTRKCTVSRAAALEVHMVDTVACGSDFTIAVTKQGQTIGWGGGEFGQIGAPVVVQQVQPRLIKGVAGVRIERVAAGAVHVLALSQQYQLFSFGMGLHGALGHGDEESRCAAVLRSTRSPNKRAFLDGVAEEYVLYRRPTKAGGTREASERRGKPGLSQPTAMVGRLLASIKYRPKPTAKWHVGSDCVLLNCVSSLHTRCLQASTDMLNRN